MVGGVFPHYGMPRSVISTMGDSLLRRVDIVAPLTALAHSRSQLVADAKSKKEWYKSIGEGLVARGWRLVQPTILAAGSVGRSRRRTWDTSARSIARRVRRRTGSRRRAGASNGSGSMPNSRGASRRTRSGHGKRRAGRPRTSEILLPLSSESDVTSKERGPLLESWVVTTLRAHAEVQDLYDEMSYWAPHQSETEVDVLLQRGHEVLAIEVKSTERYHTGPLKGLRALDVLPQLVRRVLIYTGRRSFVAGDGIEVWPARRFAAAVAEGRLWP